jgi:signal transduction histidine kinase
MVMNNLKSSKVDGVSRVVELLEGNRGNLAQFLSTAGRLDQVINFLKSLDQRLACERKTALNELQELNKNIEHIKEIVVMQQSYARISGVTEKVKPTDLVEDTLRMNAGALDRHGVQVVREYDPELPEIIVEKHKVLQILVNLIRNAKYACDEAGLENKCMTVRVANGDKHVRISVTDNGVGIPAENLERIFNHGFTTREHGHGFGLHSGALAAKELGGSLVVRSDGPGKGATFTLELPVLPGAGSGARGSLPRPHGAREGWREGDTIASRSEALATIAPTPQPALAHSEADSGEPSPCVTP